MKTPPLFGAKYSISDNVYQAKGEKGYNKYKEQAEAQMPRLDFDAEDRIEIGFGKRKDSFLGTWFSEEEHQAFKIFGKPADKEGWGSPGDIADKTYANEDVAYIIIHTDKGDVRGRINSNSDLAKKAVDKAINMATVYGIK